MRRQTTCDHLPAAWWCASASSISWHGLGFRGPCASSVQDGDGSGCAVGHGVEMCGGVTTSASAGASESGATLRPGGDSGGVGGGGGGFFRPSPPISAWKDSLSRSEFERDERRRISATSPPPPASPPPSKATAAPLRSATSAKMRGVIVITCQTARRRHAEIRAIRCCGDAARLVIDRSAIGDDGCGANSFKGERLPERHLRGHVCHDGRICGRLSSIRTRLGDAQVLVVEVYRDGLLRRVGEEREHPAVRLRELNEDRPSVVVILHVRPVDVALELIAFGGQLEAWRGLVGHERSQRTCAIRGEGGWRDRTRCASRAARDAPRMHLRRRSRSSAPLARRRFARPVSGSTSPGPASPVAVRPRRPAPHPASRASPVPTTWCRRLH